MAYIATHQGRTQRVKISEPAPNRFTVTLGEKDYHVDFLEPQRNIFSLIIDGRSFEVDVDTQDATDHYDIVIKGDPYEIEMVEEKKKKLAMKLSKGVTGRQDLKSPMAGNVRQVLVQPGHRVVAGQVLLILEAMKMENEIKSPIEGIVSSVTAREGVAVANGDPLCVVEPWEPEFPNA
jgi:biotin carboxyl carrier protein